MSKSWEEQETHLITSLVPFCSVRIDEDLDSVERIAKKLRFLTTGLAKKEFSPLDAHMSHQELGLDLNNNYYKNLVDMSSDEGRPQSPSASGGD